MKKTLTIAKRLARGPVLRRTKQGSAMNRPVRGSALVFALIMLSVMIVIAVGSFSASVVDQKTSNDTEKSVSAFQAADTGVEKVLQIINSEIEAGGSLQTLAAAGLCNDGAQYVDDGVSLNGRKIAVSYYKTGSVLVTDCALATINDIALIRSTGEFGGTVRAVSVSVRKPCKGLVTDAEGNSYGVVGIGSQCWMAKNMNVGTKLANATTPPSNDSVIEKWCYGDSDANCTTYGGLYTWAEALQLPMSCDLNDCSAQIIQPNHQGICPVGWHIPGYSDWSSLVNFAGGSNCDMPTGQWGCDDPGDAGIKLNLDPDIKFMAELGGQNNAGFSNLGVQGIFRGVSQGAGTPATNAHYRLIKPVNATTFEDGVYNADAISKTRGFSVRCIRD